MQDIVLSPTDFVALVNQTLEFAYPLVVVEGELANFRIAKNRWIYFDLKDEVSNVAFFGTVYSLPGPLEDGLKLRVTAAPRLHQRFGFNLNAQTIVAAGEGSIKKAADLLRAKLLAEGLFEPARKRNLPTYPTSLGLITAADSAAYGDFIKIINHRWAGLEIQFFNSLVQGEQASLQLASAIEHFNQLAVPPEVLAITRGGGSADDLAAFNDERVVRAVAASRIPTIVGVGHENDESLAELAADVRASTPTNVAQLVVPDKAHEQSHLQIKRQILIQSLGDMHDELTNSLAQSREYLTSQVFRLLEVETERLTALKRLAALFDPSAALKRGYALVRQKGRIIKSVRAITPGDLISLELADGKISSKVSEVQNG